jgi:pyruvate dehydrogenase (quinone)
VGTALGMANGIQALDTTRQVIALCGDGGFAMLMQEFLTSVQHGLPVKVVVFNNGAWGLVHLEMEEAALPAFKQGSTFKNPDFALFAKACGAEGFTVTNPSALRETIARALEVPGPVVEDVIVDPSEIPSMPHLTAEQVWRFGVGKLREMVGG